MDEVPVTQRHIVEAVPIPAAPRRPHSEVVVKLSDTDGNAYAILGAVRRALQRAGQHDLAAQFLNEATAGDYDDLLATCFRYVHVE